MKHNSHLAWLYQLGRITVAKIIEETCQAIWKILSPIYLKSPDTEEEWKSFANNFEELLNLPHVIGAIDGKHVAMERPKKSGSMYCNYNWFYISTTESRLI